MNPDISVIMLAYNETPKILSQAINSILNQTFKNFELIIILDNPKNNVLKKLIDKYLKKDRRIKFIENKKNLGVAGSSNIGIKNSNAKYIAKLDGDDIALKNRLELQYNYLEKNKHIDLVYSSVMKIDENGKYLYTSYRFKLPQYFIKKKLLKNSFISHSSIMYRKNDVLYREKFETVEDYDFFLRLLSKNIKFGVILKPLTKYRYRNVSASNRNKYMQIVKSQIAKKFYYERKKLNKDSYDKVDEILKKCKVNNEKLKLKISIQIAFRNKEFKIGKSLLNKYFQKNGYFNKYLIYLIVYYANKDLLVRI